MKGYINNPKTIEEFAHNAKFQCDNVSSWIYLNDYESAMIKAKCLIEELELIIKFNDKANKIDNSIPILEENRTEHLKSLLQSFRQFAFSEYGENISDYIIQKFINEKENSRRKA